MSSPRKVAIIIDKKIGAGLIAATLAILFIAAAGEFWHADAAKGGKVFPDPAVDVPASGSAREQIAVVAGGCFWGIQAIFQHVKGVKSATSGYSGGMAATAKYELVSMGDTGHAESVQITFDPAQISYGQLLKVFFSIAHDPTQLNRQEPDIGTQYRSVIFYGDEEQKQVAESYIAQLDQAKSLPRPIVTQVVPLKGFYPAEDYHQNYASRHPDDEYIWTYDAPKVDHLRKEFPDLYKK